MSTLPALRSTTSTPNSLEFMRQVLEASNQVAELEMRAQEISVDSHTPFQSAKALAEIYAGLQTRVGALQNSLGSVKVATFAREALTRDVQELVENTRSLGERIELLIREGELNDRITKVLHMSVDISDKPRAASILRSRANELPIQLGDRAADVSASLIRYMHAVQAHLHQRATVLEEPASTPVQSYGSSVAFSPSSTHRMDLMSYIPPSVIDDPARAVATNPGKFLNSMVESLTERDFRKQTSVMWRWWSLIPRLPKTIQEEIFNNMERISNHCDGDPANEHSSSDSMNDFRVVLDAITTSSAYITYKKELKKTSQPSEAPSERSPSPPVTWSSSTGTLRFRADAPSAALHEAVSSLSSSSALSSTPGGSFLPNLKESESWLTFMTYVDTHCSQFNTSRERRLYLIPIFSLFRIPAEHKLDIYVRLYARLYAQLPKNKGMDPSTSASVSTKVFYGRTHLGDNMQALLEVLNAKYEEAIAAETAAAGRVRSPKSDSLSSTPTMVDPRSDATPSAPRSPTPPPTATAQPKKEGLSLL